jgi:diphthamide synthase subunit DPH2
MVIFETLVMILMLKVALIAIQPIMRVQYICSFCVCACARLSVDQLG